MSTEVSPERQAELIEGVKALNRMIVIMGHEATLAWCRREGLDGWVTVLESTKWLDEIFR